MDNLRRTLGPLGRMDWVALICTFSLLGIGVAFIYSAGYGRESTQWIRQILFILLGIPVYLFAAFFDYRRLREWAYPLYLISLVLLVGLYFFGMSIHGARRWYNIFGLLYFQPAEVAKLAIICLLAMWFSDTLRNLRRPANVIVPLLLTLLPFGLIAAQPDVGTAFILLCIFGAILFSAGVSWKLLGMLALLGVLSLPIAWTMLRPYHRDRIMVYLEPDRDPLGRGWNRRQSEIAIGSGGLHGKGFKQGTQNVLGFLPVTVAPTDFIYSVIAEEKGFIGCTLMLTLYSVLFVALARTSLRSQDVFGRLMTIGILTMLCAHVTINVAMTIGLLPIIGLPLPLVSYGGSFVLSMMLALGLAQSVYIRRS
ncbi:MAG: rod shape-determining protein RodA [Verrucomicrobia bacterium]|nr:rod shape-determining protein RodA [Verrucomicrobiota bacterium]MCH8510898.1 rod shape-determining protein RodA [Kiritimatiellia bacterium]